MTISTAVPTAAAAHNVTTNFFYYFAFGSNLLLERIQVKVKNAEFESVGRLNNFKLEFFDHSRRWEGAVASIEESSGAEVWGCVWRAPNEFAEDLDEQERGYHRLQVDIDVDNNRTISCRTYQYSNPSRVRKPPSPHYKHVIVTGAKEHNLPVDYIKKLEAIPDNGYRGRVELDLRALKELNNTRAADAEG